MENKEFDLRNYLYNNPLLESEDSKKGNKEEQKRAKKAKEDDAKHIADLEKDKKFQKEKLAKLKKDYSRDVKKVKKSVKEGEESTLRKAIQNEITSILKEAEVEGFDATKDIEIEDNEEENIDIEKETDVKVDDESEESEIEVDDEVAGQDAGVSAIEGLLKKARKLAIDQGDDKLVTQLSNTITQHERSEAAKIDQSLSVAEDSSIDEGGNIDYDFVKFCKENPQDSSCPGSQWNEGKELKEIKYKKLYKNKKIKTRYGYK